MENEKCASLIRTISEFPLLYRFFDDAFIEKQCTGGLKNFLLVHSDNVQALQYLEGRLKQISEVEGYNRLGSRLIGAGDLDQYREVLAQIDTSIWFYQKGLLAEIEPTLPHRQGSCDILINFSQNIYCEVYSPESFEKSFGSAKPSQNKRIEKIRQDQQWMSEQDAEHEERNQRVKRNMKVKTRLQLPQDRAGILWTDGSRSSLREFDVKAIAKRLFPIKPQVALIMLWNDDRGSDIGEPPFCFVNTRSSFQELARRLLERIDRVDLMS